MRRHRDAALHVGGARAEQPVALALQRPPRERAERIHRVVVAEQRDARASRALERGVDVEAGRRRHELARHPVAGERVRELAGEPIELGRAPRSASRAATQRAMSPSDQLEIGSGGVVHPPGGGDRVRHAAAGSGSEALDARGRPVDRERAADDLRRGGSTPQQRESSENCRLSPSIRYWSLAEVARAEIAGGAAALTGRRRRVRLVRKRQPGVCVGCSAAVRGARLAHVDLAARGSDPLARHADQALDVVLARGVVGLEDVEPRPLGWKTMMSPRLGSVRW